MCIYVYIKEVYIDENIQIVYVLLLLKYNRNNLILFFEVECGFQLGLFVEFVVVFDFDVLCVSFLGMG